MTGGFLVGKLALVTGGSGTIGKAIARALLASGTSVVLTARRLEKLEETKKELLENLEPVCGDFPKIHVIPSDVSKEESVVNLFKSMDVLSNGGKGVDLLVNNAGTKICGWNLRDTDGFSSTHHLYLLLKALWFQDQALIFQQKIWGKFSP